jgi:hypothetical protein
MFTVKLNLKKVSPDIALTEYFQDGLKNEDIEAIQAGDLHFDDIFQKVRDVRCIHYTNEENIADIIKNGLSPATLTIGSFPSSVFCIELEDLTPELDRFMREHYGKIGIVFDTNGDLLYNDPTQAEYRGTPGVPASWILYISKSFSDIEFD